MAQTLKFGNKVWAAKEDSVLAYNDINNNYKPLPFDFARASIGTRVNKDGLIETMGQDIARIDYTDSADGVLLLEPSSTNLITYSEDFSQWTTDRVTVSQNQIVSPNGTLNADLIAENSENNIHRIYIGSITLTDNVDYTITVFAKKGTSNAIQLTPTSTSAIGSGRANFDLDNGILGAVSGGTAEIKDYGNGWYRCSYSFEALATATSAIAVNLINDDLNAVRNVTYLGNINNNVYLWGAQFEALSYPTSYIPTSGSTVTRAAETCNNSGNSEVFNDSEGVLFLDINYKNIQSTWQGIAITNNNSASNRIFIGTALNTKTLEIYFQSGGVVLWQPDFELSKINQFQKIAVKYKANDLALFVNGFEVATDNSVTTMPIGLSLLGFFGFLTSEPQYGCTKEIGYYDTALTDAELETLTSYRNWVSMVNELNLNIIYNG